MNRGELNQLIEIWGKVETEDIDELDEKVIEERKLKEVLAKKEFRGGGLLTGRPADTVLTQTTQKFTYVYNEFPQLIADKHWIKHNGVEYKVLYTLNEGDKNEFLQVFTSEANYE